MRAFLLSHGSRAEGAIPAAAAGVMVIHAVHTFLLLCGGAQQLLFFSFGRDLFQDQDVPPSGFFNAQHFFATTEQMKKFL